MTLKAGLWLRRFHPERYGSVTARARDTNAAQAFGLCTFCRYHHRPLTPALSPSAGEREDHRQSLVFFLSPAEGEKAGVRGNLGALPR